MFQNRYKFTAHCHWLRQEVYNNYYALIMHKYTAHCQWLRPKVYKYPAHCQWLRPKSCINTQPIVIGSDKKYIIIIMP